MIVLVIILLSSLISSLTHDNSISDSRHVTATDVSGFLFGGRNHQWPAGPGRLGPHALAMSESAMPCFGSEREECQEPQESPVYRRARVSVLSCRVGAAAAGRVAAPGQGSPSRCGAGAADARGRLGGCQIRVLDRDSGSAGGASAQWHSQRAAGRAAARLTRNGTR